MKLIIHYSSLKTNRGFTLIELLVALAVVVGIAAVIVVILNPAEHLREARDAKRIADLNNLDLNLTSLTAAARRVNLGSPNTVYVSLPDTSSTCFNYVLPELPDGWSYNCVPEADLRRVDGLGWVPVDFTEFPGGAFLSALPIDPKNAAEDGLYYTYVVGSWELTAKVESEGYRNGGSRDIESTTGSNPQRYQQGSAQDATPLALGDGKGWRRINLVKNSSGEFEDNTNFSQFVYEPNESFDAIQGSFSVTSGSTSRMTDELIAVDSQSQYRVSGAIKMLDDNNQPGAWRYYFGVTPYDSAGRQIANVHVNQVAGSARTVLAEDLNIGDPQIVLEDASGWYNGSTSHMRGIRFYLPNHPDVYEDYGYSRLVTGADLWPQDGISGNVITLNSTWPGPFYPTGTKVSNAQSGSTYMYTAASNLVTQADWEFREGIILGPADIGTAPSNRFWNGTYYVKILWLLNRNGTGSATTAIDAVFFEKFD